MTTRDDYPWPVGNPQQAIKQHGVMCNEIDRLRDKINTLIDRLEELDPPSRFWAGDLMHMNPEDTLKALFGKGEDAT